MSCENKLRVYLGDYRTPIHAYKNVVVEQEDDPEAMKISFKRTIRVPDDGETYNLPPSLGHFPIYNINQYKTTIPESMLLKGGCFMPVYNREALWIKFKSTRPFAVKVLVGSINAISGEPIVETFATHLRRSSLLAAKKIIQDYVIIDPADEGQMWLDGIAKANGKVQQFVAVPSGSGYSVEAQIAEFDHVSGIQIMITPIKLTPKSHVIVNRIDGSQIICPNIRSSCTVFQLMKKTSEQTGTPIEQFSLLFNNRKLTQNFLLSHYQIDHNSKIYMTLNLKGGGIVDFDGEMSIGAGGLIKQSILRDPHAPEVWDTDNSVLFNVQLLDASHFQRVTGHAPPPSPVTAETYAAAGLPFFALPEEVDSGISGNFEDIQSIDQLNATARINKRSKKKLNFRVIQLDRRGQNPSFVPVQNMIKQLKGFGFVQPK